MWGVGVPQILTVHGVDQRRGHYLCLRYTCVPRPSKQFREVASKVNVVAIKYI